MINGFLGKVRIWTLVAATALAFIVLPSKGPLFAVGLWGAALWSILSFWAVEHLVRQALLPRETPRNGTAIILLVVAKISLYSLGFWILKDGVVPPLSCFFGFTILLAVLVMAALVLQPKLVVQPNLRPDDSADRGNDD